MRSRTCLIALLLSCCFSAFANDPLAAHFVGKTGCFLQRELASGRVIRQFGGAFCKQRLSPNSTFKIPLALMGFESTALKDANTTLKWDKRKREIEAWNRDHTVRSWLQDSVVWFSQRVAPMIGRPNIDRYLKDFAYGNADFSGGITQAWLDSSLKISAEEQTEFLRKLKLRKLPLSRPTVDKLFGILPVETKQGELELSGKTGSGFSWADPDQKDVPPYRLGWYVGYFKQGNSESVFATVFKAPSEKGKLVWSGQEAKTITKAILGVP